MNNNRRDFEMYCICGAEYYGRGTTEDMYNAIKTHFLTTHTGDGHGPCDEETARKNRSKAEEIERGK